MRESSICVKKVLNEAVRFLSLCLDQQHSYEDSKNRIEQF